MISLTDGQKIQIHLMMLDVLNDPNETDPEAGLFQVWDYLDNEGFPTHEISQYISEEGQLLTNKALLGNMIGL